MKNFFKMVLAWFGWKFRIVQDNIEKNKTVKYSHKQEKSRRVRQMERGII